MPEENEWDYAKDLIKCECGYTPSLYRKNDWFRVVCDSCGSCSGRFVEAKDAVQNFNELVGKK